MKKFGAYFTALIASTLAVNLCLCTASLANAMECRRVQKNAQREHVGLDNFRKGVSIDTGKCQRVSVNGTSDCPDAHCVNTTTDYVTLNLLGSLQNYWVIAECGLSLSQCRGCQREHKFLRFFAGTPHEQVVDTGRCGGQCSQTGQSCKATAMRPKAVSGPNGDLTVDVIEECSCQGDCYRMSYWESYYEKITDDKRHTKEEEKMIDVGRCTGSCRKMQCYPSSIGPLCSRVPCGPDPQSLTKKTFTNRNGDNQTLPIIGKCKCQM